MFRYLATLISAIALISCANDPLFQKEMERIQSERQKAQSESRNVVSTGEIKFDGTKYIRVQNILCSNGIIFSLYQDTKQSKNGVVILGAGIAAFDNIGSHESLHINLDGKISSHKSVDLMTEYGKVRFLDGSNSDFSHKRYLVSESFTREIASSNQFLVKIDLLNKTFREGNCSAATLEDYQKAGMTNVTIEQVEEFKKNAAVTGFQKFVKLMDSTAW